MDIGFLGHAGFCVEKGGDMLVIDPWLCPSGALDAAWFQFPRNHHLIDGLRARLAAAQRTAIYITHEHEDHFCKPTMLALKDVVHQIIIPDYEIKTFRDALSAMGFPRILEVPDLGRTAVGNLSLDIYVDESGINRDSAILVRDTDGFSFLNLNDCKIYDRADAIRATAGAIDVFSCQFSGATMHPACYDYPPDVYRTISRRKRLAKFAGVRTVIERLQPRAYIPSAGPPAFLDPGLFHLNSESDSVFPRAWEYAEFLRKSRLSTDVAEMEPGDTLRVGAQIEKLRGPSPAVGADNVEQYLADYQRQSFIDAGLSRIPDEIDVESVLHRLIADLEEKLKIYSPFRAALPVKHVVYFSFEDSAVHVRIDFSDGSVRRVGGIAEADYTYEHRTALARLARVLAGEQTWSAYTATFRFRNRRVPDVYDTVISLLFFSDKVEFEYGLRRIAEFRRGGQRIEIETATGERFEINRFCPHQGADLSFALVDGSAVVCPRHHWRFDLEAGGKCVSNGETICAAPIEETA